MDCKEYKEAIAIVQEELRLLQKEKQNEVNSHMETLEKLNTTKANYKEAIAIVQEELRLLKKEKQNEANSHIETLKELNAAKAEINKLKEMVDMDEGKKWLIRRYKQQSLSDKLTIGSLNAQILKLRQEVNDLNPSARTEVKVPPTPTPASNPALKSYRIVRVQEHGKRLKGMRQENIDKRLKDAEDAEDVKKGGLGNLRY
jgi:uncharacterized protein YoaH (UPF0181 family)